MKTKQLDTSGHKWTLLGATVVVAAGTLAMGAWSGLRARARALLAPRHSVEDTDARSRMEGEGGPSPGALRAATSSADKA
ncbi:MAG: hypothetical protein Q8L48_31000 [Archangium sp.]|nr:hypothetical protein [Archangium sp.]